MQEHTGHPEATSVIVWHAGGQFTSGQSVNNKKRCLSFPLKDFLFKILPNKYGSITDIAKKSLHSSAQNDKNNSNWNTL